MCGAKPGGPDAAGIKPGETTIQGSVTRDGEPVTGYVRLLDSTGEFTAEVPTSATGQFRFYAAEGTWTVRALVPGGTADREVVAQQGGLTEVTIAASSCPVPLPRTCFREMPADPRVPDGPADAVSRRARARRRA